jgi:hypothetical protein
MALAGLLTILQKGMKSSRTLMTSKYSTPFVAKISK